MQDAHEVMILSFVFRYPSQEICSQTFDNKNAWQQQARTQQRLQNYLSNRYLPFRQAVYLT